jgi:hypothetical protein
MDAFRRAASISKNRAMIEAAQRKLREASFFYRHLAGEPHRGHDADPEGFRFYFSAFIGAARSVTWAMKSEDRNDMPLGSCSGKPN